MAAAALLVGFGTLLWIALRTTGQDVLPGEPVVALLADRGGREFLTESGQLIIPLRETPSSSLSATVKDLLTKNAVPQPESVRSALAKTRTDTVERGSSGAPAGDPLPLQPFATAVKSTHPSFSWRPVESATEYTLYLKDGSGKSVWQGTSGNRLSLTMPPSAPTLNRGEVYYWQVEATVAGLPRLSRWDAFTVLDQAGFDEVNSAEKRYGKSALLLGAIYESHGLYIDAKDQFEYLAKMNPTSPLPAKMLDSLKKLRETTP